MISVASSSEGSPLAALQADYVAYVDTYRDAAGALPKMMQLKLIHTQGVIDAATRIAEGEGFDLPTTIACKAAALLHDTGRYEQLKRYNTFRDSESVDHAVFSHDIVKEKGWLAGWDDKDAILWAVLVHNRRDIPTPAPSARALICAKTVRDADKLDIFRVLEDQITNTNWREDNRAFWNLKITAAPNPAVLDAIRAGKPVDYQAISCLADFVLIQVGWMMNGLEYATSRHLCAARGHLAFRRRFLHELTDSPAIDEICDLAEGVLAK